MKNSINLLDCTLRDGGYVNKWNFGNGNITCIYDRLNEAGVDIIEIGFLDDREQYNPDRTIQPNTQALSQTFSKIEDKKAMIVAMIDYGTCSIDNIEPRESTILDGIRVIFKKENMIKAADFGKQLIEKGYKLFLQLVSITDYTKEDIKQFSEYVKNIRPHAVSIVDTYGLMHKEQVYSYFRYLDEYLDKDIGIGYHSHNNFQLAYSNTIELLHLKTSRNIILDGTLYGMGKSAGNAPIELISMHLNEFYGKNYDINQILECINTNILPIYEKTYWGYSMFFYIAAKNDCHPNYVKYLLDKKTLSIKNVNIILDKIDPEHKLRYDEKYITSIYLEYLLDSLNDVEYVDSLGEELADKNILLLGPGPSSTEESATILKFIHDEKPVLMSVNFIPQSILPDFVFITNPLRYSQMIPNLQDNNIKIISTSNITSAGRSFDYIIRFDSLITEKSEIWDNALVIILNLFKKIGINKITLAGFDGFKKSESNYVDDNLDLSREFKYLAAVNAGLSKKIKQYRKCMNIDFLTPSVYGE